MKISSLLLPIVFFSSLQSFGQAAVSIQNTNLYVTAYVTFYAEAPHESDGACSIISNTVTVAPSTTVSWTSACNFESAIGWSSTFTSGTVCPISSYSDFTWTDAYFQLDGGGTCPYAIGAVSTTGSSCALGTPEVPVHVGNACGIHYTFDAATTLTDHSFTVYITP